MLLRRVPGVHIGQPGSRGGRASIYTRGLDPNHTLILIDGVRMNDPTNNRGGSFDLSTLDPAGVERIEISRGSISAVHGSDAIAGVVNIITRTGRDAQEFLLDVSGGRWGVVRVAGQARGARGDPPICRWPARGSTRGIHPTASNTAGATSRRTSG